MARIVPSRRNAVDNIRCPACGVKWENHNGMTLTCQELQSARKQLIELRITFFILCLKYLPPEAEFTPDDLLKAVLKKPSKR